jgi:hypothetical protein
VTGGDLHVVAVLLTQHGLLLEIPWKRRGMEMFARICTITLEVCRKLFNS